MYRIGQEEKDALARVIDSKELFKINGGPNQECMKAEEDMRRIFNVNHAIVMTSGHAALVSALVAMGVGPGDEVIVPAYTYIASAMAVVAAGAIPVIAEVDETLTLDVEDTEKKITTRTKAIMPVHIQGFPCDMDGIMALAKKYNLLVVEDACQADGGSYHGRRLGTIGETGAFSFNYFKLITTGEGGAMVTNNEEIFKKALIYHDSSAVNFFGNQLSGNNIPLFCGNEYRCHEMQAAILRVQLERMDGILADNRRIKKQIMEACASEYTFAPSNDIDGDCGTTLAVKFETEEAARRFATSEGIYGVLPIDTDKHVYSNWTPILEKRGALHPAMDPFKMAENCDFVPDYQKDMCPKTLGILAKNVYVAINPDMTEEQVQHLIACMKKAAK